MPALSSGAALGHEAHAQGPDTLLRHPSEKVCLLIFGRHSAEASKEVLSELSRPDDSKAFQS